MVLNLNERVSIDIKKCQWDDVKWKGKLASVKEQE